MNKSWKKTTKLFIPPILLPIARKVIGRPTVEKHRRKVGGMWEEIGKLQFDFLVDQGLKPEHKLLDVGCGSLRGGVHFIRYLEDGNYYGVDKNGWLLDRGQKVELPRYGLQDKDIHLVEMENFEFSELHTQFDYALAQSVFTHLPWNKIVRCLMGIEKVLGEGGAFYATFFENPEGKSNLAPIKHNPGNITSYFDRDPYHYDTETFKQICQGTSLKADYIGDWNHPRNQKMMVFKKIES